MDYLKNFINSEEPVVASRSKEIISLINFDKIEKNIKLLSFKDSNNILEEALFNIASVEYPEVDMDNYKMILDKMAIDIEKEISKHKIALKAYNILTSFNKYLFTEKGFRGNTENFYEPDNSYINKVIDNKTGIPISLSSLYILIARRLGIPIFGINLPQHFIVKYLEGGNELFIDPFNKGLIVSKSEAMNFLKQLGMEIKDLDRIPFMKVAYDTDIIKRMLNNLISIYESQNEIIKTEQMKKLSSYFD
jgi:regulator of sirC expression with transglutaminase-like and TPR domain